MFCCSQKRTIANLDHAKEIFTAVAMINVAATSTVHGTFGKYVEAKVQTLYR